MICEMYVAVNANNNNNNNNNMLMHGEHELLLTWCQCMHRQVDIPQNETSKFTIIRVCQKTTHNIRERH